MSKLIFVSIFVTTITSWGVAFSATQPAVESIECVKKNRTHVECSIKISGVISEDSVLYLTNVADTDELYHDSKLIGSTGELLGSKFYAQILPRLYSLKSISMLESPTLTLEIESVFGDAVGLSKENSTIAIVSQGEAAKVLFGYIVFGLVGFVVLGFGVSLAFFGMSNRINDGWQWPWGGKIAFVVGGSLFVVSMLKLPRFLIPSLMSATDYYLFHAFVESLAIFGLIDLICGTCWSDSSSSKIFWKRLKFLTKVLNLCILISGNILMVWSVNSKSTHSDFVLTQSILLTFTCLTSSFFRNLIPNSKKSLNGSMAIGLTIFFSSAVFLRDALIYKFYHGAGSQYYVQYCICLVLIALGYRAIEFRKLESIVIELVFRIRNNLKNVDSGQAHASSLCRNLNKEWSDLARVTILGIKHGRCSIPASEGMEALNRDEREVVPGALLASMIESKKSIYISNPPEKEKSYSRACLLIPVIHGDLVTGAIAFTARKGVKLRPSLAKILELATSSLELEVISGMRQTLNEQLLSQREAISRTQSGLVYEKTDDWGRIREIKSSTVRIIVTADGLKTTRVAEIARDSLLAWDSFSDYKSLLYAHWFSLLVSFEFLSKDVRGDDFWGISPLKFSRSELQERGSEYLGIALGFYMERIATEISLIPKFAGIGFAGAHVAVGLGEIKVEAYGIPQQLCVDIDSPYMSRLHRIRSEAFPGCILVDGTTIQMKDIVLKKCQNRLADFNNVSRFKDLSSLPEIYIVDALMHDTFLDELVKKAREIALHAYKSGVDLPAA